MYGESNQQDSRKFRILASRQFLSWLAEQHISIGVSTYQTGKLILIGSQPNGRLSVFERTYDRAMGLYGSSDLLYLCTRYQVWRIVNVLKPGQDYQGYDRLFVPRCSHVSGDLDIHDIADRGDEGPVFVNTLFSCLATTDDHYNFRAIWRPPFISRLAAEDRCHMNGMATKDGKPVYVTAVSESDVADGWRDHRRDGGVVIRVSDSTVICRGLSMPHSPRLYGDRLWLLNSGVGDFGFVDIRTGEFTAVAFCPGYARGLAFVGDFALIGLSRPRNTAAFEDLALDANLAAKKAEPRCGVIVVDLRSGDLVHWLRFDGMVEELYDVVAIPGARRPMALGFKTDEICRYISHT